MKQDTPRGLPPDAVGKAPALIMSIPASVQQRRSALGIVIFFSVVFALVVPFAPQQVGRVDAFIPVVHSIICVTDLITAVILFAQYSIQPRAALLALAGGYICGGLLSFLLTLEFPGAYAATGGLLGGESSGAAWLFNFWRITFALAVIAYVLLKDTNEAPGELTREKPIRAIVTTIACALLVTVGLTWLGTAGNGSLPSLYAGTTQQAVPNQDLAGALWLLNVTALVLLLARTRTILDVWLAVTLLMALPDYSLAFFYSALRFSLGWYVARGYALIASFTVLTVLLAEITVLYGRLASAMALQQRERADRLMTVEVATSAMAHEIRQPLTGIASRGTAAMNWLERTPPDLEKVRSLVKSMVDSSHRANEIIEGIRGLFKRTSSKRTVVHLNDLTQQVLRIAKPDLDGHEVSVTAEYQENLPQINADRVQLQQVILNLINNAIDAMDVTAPGTRRLRLLTGYDGNSVVSLYIQDSGPGISAKEPNSIFAPFFTTKPTGMGLGLSICRAIVEDHGGTLRVAKTGPNGSSFEIALPIYSPAE